MQHLIEKTLHSPLILPPRILKILYIFHCCCYLIAVSHEGQISEGIIEGLDNQSVIGTIFQRGQIIVSKLE